LLHVNVSSTNDKEEIKEAPKLVSNDSQDLKALKEKLEQIIGIAQECLIQTKLIHV
jgi:hypothetical protein